MKKSLALLLVLVLLCVSGVCYAAGELIEDSDEVLIREMAIYGDTAVAEGLDVHTRITCRHHLFWEIDQTAGKGENTDTNFRFSAETDYEDWEVWYSGVSLNSGLDYNYDITETDPLWSAYAELYAQTPNGQHGEMTIKVGDYYDYYPIDISISVPGYSYDWNNWAYGREDFASEEDWLSYQEVQERFDEFFRIPVLEDDYKIISIEKDETGNVYGWGGGWSGEGDNYSIYAQSAVLEDAVYFTLNNRSSNNEIVDFSLVPGGYGIYKLPCTIEYRPVMNLSTGDTVQAGTTQIHASELEMVYSLREEQDVIFFVSNADRSKLLLFTDADGLLELTVIDSATMETLQVIEIVDGGEADHMWTVFPYDDFIALELSNGRLVLIELTEDGDYEKKFIVNMYPGEETLYYLYKAEADAMDWDGEKLAVAGFKTPGSLDNRYVCDYYIAVYDETGLLYYGEYDSSLSTDYDRNNYSDSCRAMDNEPMTIEWN